MPSWRGDQTGTSVEAVYVGSLCCDAIEIMAVQQIALRRENG